MTVVGAGHRPGSRPAAAPRPFLLALVLAVGAALATVAGPVGAAGADDAGSSVPDARTVHLVTLDGPGTAGHRGPEPRSAYRQALVAAQDAVLARAGVVEPLYRWTTALNGFAAPLTDEEAARLRADPEVRVVEENAVLPLTATTGPLPGVPGAGQGRGGAGVVIGVVDTGVWPESSLFADVPGLGRMPKRFEGTCQAGQDWSPTACQGKLVGARWFVSGFGEDNLRSSSALSARDDSGHGTQMASIAAGNAGVSVTVPGRARLGSYAGVAPQARVAVYKACWTAPDPDDDGCATADLVTAIDRATRDGVDVLNLAVGGPSETDTVERALLGAAERDVVVVAAAGNGGTDEYAAHASPWVTSVGGVTGDLRRGRVETSGPDLAGAMASARPIGPARLVAAVDVAATDATRDDARLCVPGSLDASRVAGTIVLCERGGLGRVEKSRAVRQADGVGMVLVNVRRGTVESDLHHVPSVHLARPSGERLIAWHARHPRARVRLAPLGLRPSPPRVAPWSSGGAPTGSLVKPDLVAPGVALLGSVPPGVRGTRWDFVSGTSAATAWTSGTVARLLARHDWSATEVRSALATTAGSVAGTPSALRSGAGLPSFRRADRARLALLVAPGDYRDWLAGDLPELNTPSVLLRGDDTARRTVTNTGRRTAYFSAAASGFTDHVVTVTPAGALLAPGESATFRISATGPEAAGPLDDGWVTWRGPAGSRTRIPVVLAR